MNEETLDVDGAAILLGLKRSTIRAWCQHRKLPYFKIGRAVRFRRSSLEKLIDAHTVGPLPNRKAKVLQEGPSLPNGRIKGNE